MEAPAPKFKAGDEAMHRFASHRRRYRHIISDTKPGHFGIQEVRFWCLPYWMAETTLIKPEDKPNYVNTLCPRCADYQEKFAATTPNYPIGINSGKEMTNE